MSEHTAISCVHHWILEEPQRSIVNGTCKKCGEARKFRTGERSGGWRANSRRSA